MSKRRALEILMAIRAWKLKDRSLISGKILVLVVDDLFFFLVCFLGLIKEKKKSIVDFVKVSLV